MSDELAGEHHPLAESAAGGEAAAALGGDPGGGGAEHGVRGGAGVGGDAERGPRPDRATRFIETRQGILSYEELAPLLAERVRVAEAGIEAGCYEGQSPDDFMLLDLHRRICGDLVPEWAGQWRDIEIRVGNLSPPLPHEVAVLMRDYGRDLQARWAAAVAEGGELLLELLAFAEGRFLTVHPFRDFNGRSVRLFLTELLRRLDLPVVVLEAQGEVERQAYFQALEVADGKDWKPLMRVWQERLEQAG